MLGLSKTCGVDKRKVIITSASVQLLLLPSMMRMQVRLNMGNKKYGINYARLPTDRSLGLLGGRGCLGVGVVALDEEAAISAFERLAPLSEFLICSPPSAFPPLPLLPPGAPELETCLLDPSRLLGLKHINAIPVLFRASANVFLTFPRYVWTCSSPERRVYD